MSLKLTARQQQVLDLIQAEIANSGFPPTRAEIARALGFKSANAAEDHLKALARKGAIILTPGASRGIRLATTNQKKSIKRASNFDFSLPLIGRVAAGNPILAHENIEREISIEQGLFATKPDYLLRVNGYSMRDAGILDGDLLAVKKTPQANHGQIVVARIHDEVTVKRLWHKNNSIQLLPENPDFQPIKIQPHDDFAIEGRAVGLIRSGNI